MRPATIISLLCAFTPLTIARPWTTKDACPTKIQAKLWGKESRSKSKKPSFTNMDTIHTALLTCPNITALDLSLMSTGCTGESPSRWDLPLDPFGRTKYANLTSLRLEKYDFSYSRQLAGRDDALQYWKERVKSQVLSFWPGGTHLDLWIKAMNWSGIEELMIEKITDEHMVKLPPLLHSLRRLETSNSSFIYALPNDSLTNLTYTGPMKELPAVLAHQGQKLRSLHARTPEYAGRAFELDFDVTLLANMTPKLEHVTMNIARNGTWPFETLDVLASLPHLASADFYMGIQSTCAQQHPRRYLMKIREYSRLMETYHCSGADRYQQPFVSKEGAEQVFAYMRKEKQGVALHNVTIYVGDWARGWLGPIYEPDWMENKKAKVFCSADGYDEKCVVQRADRYWEYNYEEWYREEDREWDAWEEEWMAEEKRWEELEESIVENGSIAQY